MKSVSRALPKCVGFSGFLSLLLLFSGVYAQEVGVDISFQTTVENQDPAASDAEEGIVIGDDTDANSMLQSMPQDMDGSIAPGAQPSGGKFNYQPDLFTGRFTYSVPIAVAPGRQGAHPTLNLGYNSSGGNGWCGVGWALEVGFIQRETKKGVPVKWALPSATPLSEYDDSKGFVASLGVA